MQIALRPLQNLIHPVEFPLCGTPSGGFHRAGFCHPNGNGGGFFPTPVKKI